ALGAVAVLAAAVAVAPLVAVSATGGTAVAASEPRTLPALVAAEAQRDPAIGTIVLTPVEGGLAARVERGAGSTLIEQRTFAATGVLVASETPAESAALAQLVGNLAAPSGRDVAADLDALDARFVLLEPSGDDVAASAVDGIVAALDGNAVLAPVGDADAGRLWRVVPDDTGAAPVAARPVASTAVLTAQLVILGLTLLLAVPTSLRPRRARTDAHADDSPAPTFEAGDDDE
ncbi:MAG: glycosyltransferase family 2 protein, partial [Microcella sp.]